MAQEPTTLERRLVLHSQLEQLVPEAYFQPPPSLEMQYPCIVYNLDSDWVKHANNGLYHRRKRYQVTHISQDPDSPVPDVLVRWPLCTFRRRFVTANLTHDVFDLFF